MFFKKKKKSKKHIDTIKKKPQFIIEHYPHSGIYTVFRKGNWLKKEYYTGIVRLTDLFDVATHCKSIEEAKELIKLYKEQKLNTGIKRYGVY